MRDTWYMVDDKKRVNTFDDLVNLIDQIGDNHKVEKYARCVDGGIIMVETILDGK